MTARGIHASDTEDGQDARAHGGATAEGSDPTRAEDVAPTGPSAGWLPTLAVESARPRRWLLTGVLAAVVLVGVAVAAMATRLPEGTTLAGVPVTGVADAPAALDRAQAALADLELSFTTAAGGTVRRTGAELGLLIDRPASTDAVRDGLPALRTWLARPFEGPRANPVVVVPPVPEVLAAVADEVSTDPVNADVQVRGADVDVVAGEDGLTSGPGDVAAGLAAALVGITTADPGAWPQPLAVDVAGQPEPPPVGQDDIDAIIAAIEAVAQAEVHVTADVPAEVEDGGGSAVTDARAPETIRLSPTELRGLVAVEPDPDAPAGQRLRLVPDLAEPPARVARLLDRATINPVVRASIENRSPTPAQGEDVTAVGDITGDVVAGETLSPGFEPDREATMAAVIEAALDGGGDVDVVGAPFEAPTPADMGIVEPVSTFTSYFPAGESRVQNIHRIADLVDGTIIPAGETYELNHAVGRRTVENGFTLGGAILDGELVSDVGGGVSQFATTFFNAAWFAGVDLVDWMPHSIYFARYPAGREATINYPNVNLEIRNDTPYAILVDTEHTASSVTVTFWSTPHWQVQTVTGPCACGGSFSITVDRIRTEPGGTPIEESWTTTYTVPRPSTR